MAIDFSSQFERKLYVDENIFYTSVQKDMNLRSLQQQEEKEMTKLFHIRTKVKKIHIGAMLDFESQVILIIEELVKKLVLEVYDHPTLYPLGQVNKDAEMKVKKHHKNIFSIGIDFIEEVYLDLVPIDVSEVVFGSPYMHMRDEIFMRRHKEYRLIKDEKSFIINMHNGKQKISIVSANQGNKLISSNKKYVLFFLREVQYVKDLIRGKASLEECTKKQKQQLEEFSQAQRDVF